MYLPAGYSINKKIMKKFIKDKIKGTNPDKDDDDINVSKNTVALYLQDVVFDKKFLRSCAKRFTTKQKNVTLRKIHIVL